MQIINTPNAPAPIGPYSQAVKAGNLLFISGQIPIDPATGSVEATDVIGETHQVMHNLRAILTEAGLDFGNVVKTTILLSDMSLFGGRQYRLRQIFPGQFPCSRDFRGEGASKECECGDQHDRRSLMLYRKTAKLMIAGA